MQRKIIPNPLQPAPGRFGSKLKYLFQSFLRPCHPLHGIWRRKPKRRHATWPPYGAPDGGLVEEQPGFGLLDGYHAHHGLFAATGSHRCFDLDVARRPNSRVCISMNEDEIRLRLQ